MGVRQAKISGLIRRFLDKYQNNCRETLVHTFARRIPMIFFIATPTLYKQPNDVSNEKRKLF